MIFQAYVSGNISPLKIWNDKWYVYVSPFEGPEDLLLTKDIQSTDLAMPKIFSEDVTVLFSGFIARGYAAMLCFFFLKKLSGMFRGTHILISCAHQCLGNMEKLLTPIYPSHFLDDWNMLYPH